MLLFGGAGILGMKTRPKLVEIIRKYTGAPYKLGGSSIEEGYDCFSLVLTLGEEFGVTIPDAFKGQTMETYGELWLNEPEKAKQVMLDLFGELCEEKSIGNAFALDVLILEDSEGMSVGVHAGGGLLITVFTDRGVQLTNINNFKVKGVYRWVREEH